MKKLLIALALAGALSAWADRPAADVKPQAHYGSVARRLVNMLEQHHVLQHRFDDEISRRAWTNLVTQRSEERRVGKECIAVCRSRWSPYH